MDIIVDIETLGTRPGCPITEIGACAVDPFTGKIVANFSRRICTGFSMADVETAAAGNTYFGWRIERDTARWWLADAKRRETLRRTLAGFNAPLECVVLDVFSEWLARHMPENNETHRIWANGPSFDLAILEAAYVSNGMRRPWICWQERCVRTALELAEYVKGSVPWEERGPRHRALCDARHEARKLYRSGAEGTISLITRRLRERGTL